MTTEEATAAVDAALDATHRMTAIFVEAGEIVRSERMRAEHRDVVEDEFRRQPPQTGVFGTGAEPESSPLYQARLADYFQFQQRVLARLARTFPAEGWGYLKIGGDNLIDHAGARVKVGRVCGPDGQLYKIGSDIPTANTPQWTEDGLVQRDHGGEARDYYLPFEIVVGPFEPGPPLPLPTPAGDAAMAARFLHLENLIKSSHTALHGDIGELKLQLSQVQFHGDGNISVFGRPQPIIVDIRQGPRPAKLPKG